MKMVVSILAGAVSLAAANSAFAQVERCVARKIADSEQRRPISQTGSVECPAGDIVGFPPRERKHDRSGEVCITAPSGRDLVTDRVGAITVTTTSDNGGSVGQLRLVGNDQACVPISCRGAGVGQGRRWMEVNVSGETKVELTQQEVIDMTLACARNPNG